jgi:hypothetical protein
MTDFDVSVLPGLPPPGSILVIRGADFGLEDCEVRSIICSHYIAAIEDAGVAPEKPLGVLLPLILMLPPEGEAVVWSEDVDERMAELGWVRKP